jgi:hypothetical protein
MTTSGPQRILADTRIELGLPAGTGSSNLPRPTQSTGWPPAARTDSPISPFTGGASTSSG